MFNVENIDTATLVEWLKNEEIHLVDVRTPNEVMQASIEGHVAIPLHLIPLEIDKLKSVKKKIVIYCRTGARSAQACAYLANYGVENVFNLQGGIMDWARNGQPFKQGI